MYFEKDAIAKSPEEIKAEAAPLELARKLAQALRHELEDGSIESLPSKVYSALVDFEAALSH